MTPDPALEISETEAFHVDGLALITRKDAVWVTFSRPWWDLAAWLWWFLFPGRKKWVKVLLGSGERVRIRAVRVADRFVRLGTPGA